MAIRPTGPDAAQPAAVVEPRAAYQFGLSTLMLIVTLFAVVCGAFSIAPGLGIVLAIAVIPALARTCLTAHRGEVRGKPMSGGNKLGTFAGTVALVLGGVLFVAGLGALAILAAIFSFCSQLSHL